MKPVFQRNVKSESSHLKPPNYREDKHHASPLLHENDELNSGSQPFSLVAT